MICRLCKERPVSQSRLKDHDFRCCRCRNHSPSHLAARQKYDKSAKRLAKARRFNRRRIWVGREYHSTAATPERAAVINRHIKRRLGEFKESSSC